MEEIWKTIEDFPNYEVSNQGRVRNKKTGRILKHGDNGRGYKFVVLYENKSIEQHNKYIHHLVAEAFLGERPASCDINHKDGNKNNNQLDNLEYCSRSANLKHAYDNKLHDPTKAIDAMCKVTSIPIRIVETGEVFSSISKCAKTLGTSEGNIRQCLSDKHKRNHALDLHFEYVTDEPPKPKKKPFLYDYQMEAVNNLKNGCILCGSVGSGKSRTGLYYYFKENGGSIDPDYVPMKNPQDLYIITTAKKRDSLEWERELTYFLLSKYEDSKYYDNKIVIDSWNCIGKYADVKGAFFLLDEQRLVGNGAWVKSFLKIAKNNNWILLTATPGDTYMDYVPVFLANGFFKNRSEFLREHVIYSRFTKYPKIDRYVGTARLDRLRLRVLVKMNYQHQINAHHEDMYCSYDIALYKQTMRNRWDPYKDEPFQTASGLCYTLRRIVNSDPSRAEALISIRNEKRKVIVFYSFDFELDILKNIDYGPGVEIAELNGHAHQPVPNGTDWVYLVNYAAGAEAWECITTNTIVFYSQHYSYKIMTQAAGRVDRLNTPYTDLFYYYLKSRSGIDLAISKALREKKNFNEGKFVKW